MGNYDAWTRAAAGSSGLWAVSLAAHESRADQSLHFTADPQFDPDLCLPSGARFWTRTGSGHPVLSWLGVAHAGAGIFGAAAGALVWYFVASQQATPLFGGLAGLLVALAGACAFALARSNQPEAALAARLLLPMADLVASAAALWLLGNAGFAPLLFVIPITVAALLLSWRGGAVFAVLAVLGFAAVSALRLGAELDAWVPHTLALTTIATLLAICAGIYSGQLTESITTLLRRASTLRDQRNTQAAEQQRLLDGLNLLEETQARLEGERSALNAQMAELAAIARRIADGDLAAARLLHGGMYGPLDVLAASLMRMSQQMSAVQSARHYAQRQQRLLEPIAAGAREQSHLLAAADGAVRELGSSAGELAAEVRVLARGSGELPGVDRHALFQATRDIERHAASQANDAALLGSRLAQIRSRQADLEAEITRVIQAAGVPQSGDLVNRPGSGGLSASTVRQAQPAVLPPVPAWDPPAGPTH
jgi:hypothetical protein